MILGVEAVNIRNGGGLKHLKQFLEFNSKVNYFKRIIVYTNSSTKLKLDCINGIEFIVKKAFNLPYPFYIFYQIFFFKKHLIKDNCDLIFAPGSIFLLDFPSVLMPQNMLLFDQIESKRFPFIGRLKLSLISIAQKLSLNKANGVIFLSEYAFQKIKYFSPISNHIIIPHGIDQNQCIPKENKGFNEKTPMKLLYVSPLYPYKHHKFTIKAINELVNEGLNIQYKIVGGGTISEMNSLKSEIKNSNIEYIGEVSPDDIYEYLNEANVFIFASTCENLPITMLEAMSHGLPIVCSNYGVMPEVLDNSSNFFFDPTNIISIKQAISKAYFQIDSLNLEAIKNKKLSEKYKWEENVSFTNKFIKQIYEDRF